MKRGKKELSPFAKELMQSMREAIDYFKGEGEAVETRLSLPDPPPSISRQQILTLRQRLDMTQMQFARLMNVSSKTVEGWEQGLRKPGGAALRMLQIIEDPMILMPLSERVGHENDPAAGRKRKSGTTGDKTQGMKSPHRR